MGAASQLRCRYAFTVVEDCARLAYSVVAWRPTAGASVHDLVGSEGVEATAVAGQDGSGECSPDRCSESGFACRSGLGEHVRDRDMAGRLTMSTRVRPMVRTNGARCCGPQLYVSKVKALLGIDCVATDEAPSKHALASRLLVPEETSSLGEEAGWMGLAVKEAAIEALRGRPPGVSWQHIRVLAPAGDLRERFRPFADVAGLAARSR